MKVHICTLLSLALCLFPGGETIGAAAAALPAKKANLSPPIFRFSLSTEPSGADPARISNSESNYFLLNILRGLYFVDKHGVARPEIARTCFWKRSHRHLRCELKSAKWSDGAPIRAQDFVDSWSRLLQPNSKGIGFSLLQNVKKMTAPSNQVLEVTLEENDPEFIQRLAHPALVATRTDFSYDRDHLLKAPVSGPYRVTEWKPGTSEARIRLESNPFYETIQKTENLRPPVEILTIDDDETAFNLYREGTLTLLRRLPTHYLRAWKDSKELVQIPVARFDYLGFGPKLRDQLEFRQALAAALNYEELRIIYSALGTPGCPGLSPEWLSQVPCHRFDVERAKQLWAKVPAELKSKRWTLHFSKLGGDDVQKGMEWMQGQWKKNLGLVVDLKAVEQGVYLAGLKTDTPDLFRKGVGLDRSTCLAAVEIFSKRDPENFIKLDLPPYEKAIQKLRAARRETARKKACTEAVQVLIDRAEVIPLGRIHFSMLAKPDFQGWDLNPLNQLDLSHLRPK